jgi:NADH:ubiquinone oxidoreductase subunit C
LHYNYKLFFKYVFFNLTHLYLTHNTHGTKNITVVIPQNLLYFSCLHLRFSTIFYSSQLVDMFAYELPLTNSTKVDSQSIVKNSSDTIVVYNFHNLTFQERFFFFCVDSSPQFSTFRLNSIAELYPNASWLEREVSEFHGILFNNKKDLRNLMLQYGDTSAPFQKSSPSIGLKEIFYDSINDILVQNPVSIQI